MKKNAKRKTDFERGKRIMFCQKHKCTAARSNSILRRRMDSTRAPWNERVHVRLCVYVAFSGYCIFPSAIKSMKDETVLHPISPNPLQAGFTYTHTQICCVKTAREGALKTWPFATHVIPYGATPPNPPNHTHKFIFIDRFSGILR